MKRSVGKKAELRAMHPFSPDSLSLSSSTTSRLKFLPGARCCSVHYRKGEGEKRGCGETESTQRTGLLSSFLV